MGDAANGDDFVRLLERIALGRRAGAAAHAADDARDAEATLCREFTPRARLYGRRHLRDEERARDLAQAVMLAVIEAVRAGRVEDPARIDRFVLGTCRNVALRMRQVDARAEPTDAADLDVLACVPDDEIVETGALVRCLSGLDDRSRTVLFLSFAEGQSADQIAGAIESTPGNVRVLRHRAVTNLRACLDDCSEGRA